MIGNRIKSLRKKKGLTQTELGKLISLTHASISGYERGERFPDLEILCNLADVLETSTDYLLGRTENPIMANGHNEDLIILGGKTITEADNRTSFYSMKH